jgi:LysR family transcriptional activator of nhaA
MNYHHLRYFWTVARTGSIVQAGAELGLTPQTISSQIHDLEAAVGEKLFLKSGRNLVLSETGRMVFGYAQEIFALGNELAEALQGRPVACCPRFIVGVADAVPRLLAYRLLEPALNLPGSVRIICSEGKTDQLLSDLAIHAVDMVLADTPLSANLGVRRFNRLLGETGVSFFGVADLASRYREGFPASLDGAPFLMPATKAPLRRLLDEWFESLRVQPSVIGEFEDTALMKAFGQAGAGIFVAPTMVAQEVRRQYRVTRIGQTEEVRERFYAISVERRRKHPAVVAVLNAARTESSLHEVVS